MTGYSLYWFIQEYFVAFLMVNFVNLLRYSQCCWESAVRRDRESVWLHQSRSACLTSCSENQSRHEWTTLCESGFPDMIHPTYVCECVTALDKHRALQGLMALTETLLNDLRTSVLLVIKIKRQKNYYYYYCCCCYIVINYNINNSYYY